MDSFRRELIVETVKAWFEVHPAEAKAFARQLKYDWDHQTKGGRWGETAAGYKKYALPYDLVMTMAGVSAYYNVEPLIGQDEDDVRLIAQEFPDFLCRMNMDKERKRVDRRPKQKLITP